MDLKSIDRKASVGELDALGGLCAVSNYPLTGTPNDYNEVTSLEDSRSREQLP